MDPKSFENARLKWYSGVWSPYVPTVLVGTKLDLREAIKQSEEEENLEHIMYDQGKDLFDRRHNPSNLHCIQMF